MLRSLEIGAVQMEFRLLGPLEVVDAGLALELGGVKQRSLLAVLLLHANEIVSVDRLIDELWGSAPPRTVGKSIQVYVSRLRKELGDDRLVTRSPGYALRVEPSEVDVSRFEQLVATADRADAVRAGRLLREALALWRGPPLADLAYEPFAEMEVARLEELRWAGLERRIDADLAAGHHAALIGELQALIGQHPLRERLRGQLMLALYRSGRQAEALDAYRRARQELMDELGLEPGEELKRLEHAILRQDPALDLETTAAAAPPTPTPKRSVLVVPGALEGLDALLSVATPLATSRELIVAAVVPTGELREATAALAARRAALLTEGLTARGVAFASPTAGRDVVRMASREDADLLVTEASGDQLDREILEQAPCDVASLVRAGGALRAGPIIVPFGAAWHDWAALDLGACIASATGAPLQLLGAASDRRHDGRDASRLLADASLILQRTAGIVAEPLLAAPGRHGVIASARNAGLLIVGLSDRWRTEGLGRLRLQIVEHPPAPTLFVRRGPRRGGLAPGTATRFGWSLTASPA
jgi:DNA-binding SARP family transcriptional activator